MIDPLKVLMGSALVLAGVVIGQLISLWQFRRARKRLRGE